jgi:hypothetical protein
MVLVQEKLRYNIIVMVVTMVGLIVTEGVILALWFTVLAPAGAMAGISSSSKIFDNLLIPIAFTVFFSYIAGVIIRGMEKKSHGLDLYNMDIAEIEIEIGLLQKEKAKREHAEAQMEIGAQNEVQFNKRYVSKK